MSRLLISTALAGILLSGAALAQPDDHHGGGDRGAHADHQGAPAAPAAHAAPAAAPAAHAAPAAQANPFANLGGQQDRARAQAARPAIQPGGMNASHGGTPSNLGGRQDNRPAPQAAPQNAMRGPDRDNRGFDNRGPDRGGPNGMRGPGGHNNFANMQRNFNAPHRYRGPAYHRPSGWYNHRWTYGETLPSLFWSQNYWLSDYDDFDLAPPPPGTVWVRDGSDALLIDRYDGEIIQVEYDVFY